MAHKKSQVLGTWLFRNRDRTEPDRSDYFLASSFIILAFLAFFIFLAFFMGAAAGAAAAAAGAASLAGAAAACEPACEVMAKADRSRAVRSLFMWVSLGLI
jgi:small-conductance mechanosensitive channel